MLAQAFDRIIGWAKESLDSMPLALCYWLRSPRCNEPDIRRFKRLQTEGSEARYINYWKQFLYYCFRTGILEEEVRERVYGIRFTDEQLNLIRDKHKAIEADDLLADFESRATTLRCWLY
jgi:hypothetical protein